MADKTLFGVTIGDASGIGPEVLLKAYAAGEMSWDFVAYGDTEALRFYNDHLQYGVTLTSIARPSDYQPGSLNVVDQKELAFSDITPGRLSGKAGKAARDYVVSATRAALAREIAAIVTLP